jgi:HK97 family phage portal protein
MLPNKETTAYEFWHMYVFNLMLTTGAYAKIERDINGFITGIYNIPTKCVTLHRGINGERYILVSDGKKQETLREGQFMYTPGLRFQDADDPEDFVKIASDVLGLTMALNGFAKDYFESGSNLGGFIEYPGSINAAAFAKFKDDWQKAYSGVVNQHKWALLEGGFKATKFESNPEQAQALESRKFEIIEVCRLMGVPPHKVFDLERATFSNIEQQNIEYVQETIDPMAERLEQTIFKDLLTTNEQKKHFAKFNTNKLLKGDVAARTNYYNVMRQSGVFSTNDILDLEDRNMISEEEGGNIRLVNGNMIPLTAAKNNLPKAMQKGDPNAQK